EGDRAIEVGDPIFFHGFRVGRIEFVFFNSTERIVYYNAFIESPYDKLVTKNTKFWQLNGFELDLSADGIRAQTGTLETMISGGVSFDVPDDLPRGDIVEEREYFTVYKKKSDIYEKRYRFKTFFVLLFENSIRGLKIGAPVEYRGIKIGSVVRTDINYPEIENILSADTRIPVVVSVEPARMGFKDTEYALTKARDEISTLLESGLRGELATGNLLTGSKYVELTYDEGMPYEAQMFSEFIVIPTQENQLGLILQQVNLVMDKIVNLPIEPVLESAESAIVQARETLSEFRKSAIQLEKLLAQSVDGKVVEKISTLLVDLDGLILDFSEGSPTHAELQNTLMSVNSTFNELKPLLIQLNHKPNSLIFTDHKGKDLQPIGEK
ncbi:MAG: paraquat-inducible protein B, partial [Candidatus Azotimanducaceae bacterium]